MEMSYVRNWIHCVWSTKNRSQLLVPEKKKVIFNHIRENAKLKGIFLKTIGGGQEHIHCLISLSADQSLAKIIQLIKGESSFWINKNQLIPGKFEWASEYFAVSVSESQVQKVEKYILNQEEHHKKKSWDEEYSEFMRNYNFDASNHVQVIPNKWN